MDPIADRLLQYLKEVGMSKSSFAEHSGVNKASLSHLESGRNKASLSLVEAFHRCFPEVDLNWLITGEEKVVNPQQASRVPTSMVDSATEEVTAPLNNQKEKNPVLENTASNPLPSKLTSHKDTIENADNVEVTPQHPSRKQQTLTVLYSDGTYLEFKPRN